MNKRSHKEIIKSLSVTLIRWLIRVTFYFFLAILFLVLLLYLPPVQQVITGKVEKFISNKTQAIFHIDAIRLNFSGKLVLRKVYLEDMEKDTLLYAGKIELDVSIPRLLAKSIEISDLEISDVHSSLFFNPESKFTNFDFLIQAFSSSDKNEPGNLPESNWKISFRNLGFENLSIDMKIYEQMELKAVFGMISLKARSNDLKQLFFENDQIRVANAIIDLKMNGMNHSGNESDNTGDIKSLIASASKLSLENIIFRMVYNDRIRLDVNIREFAGKSGWVDLGAHKISTGPLFLSDSKMDLQISDPPVSDQDSLLNHKNIAWPFADFLWDISSEEINLDHLSLSFHNRSIPDTSNLLTNQHLDLLDLSLLAEEIGLNNQYLKTKIKKFQFREKKGFLLNKLTVDLSANPERFSIRDLKLETSQSNIYGSLETDSRILTNPLEVNQDAPFFLRIDDSSISQEDLYYFIQENPMNNYYLGSTGIRVAADGKLNKIFLEDFYLQINQSTRISSNGLLENILIPDRFSFNIRLHEFFTITKNLIQTFPEIDSFETYLPEELTASGQFKGSLKNMKGDLDFQTPRGNLGIETSYRKENVSHRDSIGLTFRIDRYDLQDFFDKDSLEYITMEGQAGVSGIVNRNIQAAIDLNISSLAFYDTIFNDLELTGYYEPEQASLRLISHDPALGLEIIANENVEDSILYFDVSAGLTGVDLKNLGISRNSLILSTKMNVNGSLIENEINGILKVDSINIKGSEDVEINEILVNFLVGGDSTYFDLRSDNISTYFSSNLSPAAIPANLKQFIIGSVGSSDTLETSGKGIISLDIQFKKPLDKFSEVFSDFKVVYLDHISIDYDEAKKYLFAEMNVPVFNYKNIRLDTLNMDFLINEGNLNYRVDADELVINSLDIANLTLLGERKDTLLTNQFIKKDSLGAERYFVEIDMATSPDRDLFIQLNPERLLLDGNTWEVSEKSIIIIDKNQKRQGQIQISQEDQQLLFKIEKDSLYSLEARNFDLHYFSDFLGGDLFQIGGILDVESSMIIQDSLSRIQAKLNVNDLIINGTQLGNLQASLRDLNLDETSFEILSDNQGNKILVQGAYNPELQRSPLRLNLDLDITSLGVFETFGNGLFTRLGGMLKGTARAEGSLQNLKINGDISLEQVGFFSEQLNNQYLIEEENITVKNNQLQLKDFTISDSLKNDFIIDGNVNFSQKEDITFNLHILADQFTIYNATEKENTPLYGQMIMSADARATGSLASPKLNLKLSVENGTDMTYVLPPKEINLVSYDEIVEFEIPDEFDTTMVLEKSNLTDTLFARFEGIDLQSDLTVKEMARFKLIIDPGSGDYITVKGRGNLNIRYQQGSDAFLSGVYNLSGGEYRVSFYGLVQKSFTIQEGSTITWTGDPENARINMIASHVLRTSSSGLVAAETVGMTDEEMRQYRRALPYEVKIFITGTFQRPEFKFSIDLIDEDRAAYPLVISKLNRINSPGYESQLTEQVFGLLTIGSFIPEQSADARSGYGAALATTAAANSLNGILTNELNKLSGKYLQGVDIDFGMQTSNQMSSGSSATQTTMDVRFSKNFSNDRITIEAETSFDVGGDSYVDPTGYNYSNFQSDFAFKYDITPKGDYKLKVFNKSSYDIIYKDIRTTGFAIIFVKDFDKLSDIKKGKEKKSQQNSK
jgi:hypothetical protein